MLGHDEVVTLPSGTEIDIASAQGDLSRASERLIEIDTPECDGLASDLLAVRELLDILAAHFV